MNQWHNREQRRQGLSELESEEDLGQVDSLLGPEEKSEVGKTEEAALTIDNCLFSSSELMTIEKKNPFQVLEKNTSLSAWIVLGSGHIYVRRTKRTLLMRNRGERNPKTQSMAEME